MPPSTDPLPAGRTRSTSTQIPATSPSSTPHRADSDVHGAQQALRTPPKSKPLASSPQTLARTKPSRARASVKSPLLQPFGYEKAAAADTDVVSASSDSEAERAPRARRSLEPSRKRSKTGQPTFLTMDAIELGPRRCDVIADGEESYFTGSLKCDCGSELQASSTILCEQCLVSSCPPAAAAALAPCLPSHTSFSSIPGVRVPALRPRQVFPPSHRCFHLCLLHYSEYIRI
jgi:hypothetical protein